MGFLILIIIILTLLPLAALPAYIAFRLKDNRLLALSIVYGVLFFFIVPWIFAVVLVCRKIPKDSRPSISFGVYSAYWGILLFAFFVLPFMSYMGLSINGYQFFSLISLLASGSTSIVCFLISLAVGCLTSLCLRNRALLIGEAVMIFFSTCLFDIWALNLFTYQTASFGTYLLLLMFLAGIASLYYLAVHMTAAVYVPTQENVSFQEIRNVLKENAAAAGQLIREHLPEPPQEPVPPPSVSSASVPPVPVPLTPLPIVPKTSQQLQIHCLRGDYADAEFTLKPGEKLILGTDPRQVNLVFQSPEISRLHLTIQNPATGKQVRLTDHSRNGTYLSTGKRLPEKTPSDFALPCTLFFGDVPQIFEIIASSD